MSKKNDPYSLRKMSWNTMADRQDALNDERDRLGSSWQDRARAEEIGEECRAISDEFDAREALQLAHVNRIDQAVPHTASARGRRVVTTTKKAKKDPNAGLIAFVQRTLGHKPVWALSQQNVAGI